MIEQHDINMQPPRVTVLMPMYNAARYLREAIESVLKQTFTDFELVIIDDGSSDESVAIVRSFVDPRISLIANHENKGIIYSLNRGLSLSRGELIARMDSDDVCLPDRLALQVEFMNRHPEIGVCGSWCRIFGEGRKDKVFHLPRTHEALKARLLFYPCFAHPTVMYRRSILGQDYDIYKSNSLHVEDYDLWLRLVNKTRFANVPKVLLNYRVHGSQITKPTNQTQKRNTEKLRGDYLQQFGLLMNENEKSLHNGLADGTLRLSFKSIIFLSGWLGRLLRENKKEGCFSVLAVSKLFIERFLVLIKRSGASLFSHNQKSVVTKLAMLVLFYEKLEQTKECIASFYDDRVKVYVLNNGSSAESVAELKKICAEKYPAVRIFDSPENLGVSGGRNFLIQNTTEEWLFFVDNDIVTKNRRWYNDFCEWINQRPDIEAFIPRLYNLREREYSLFVPLEIVGRELRRTKKFFQRRTNFFPGGAACVSRRVFDRLGNYDEAMFVGFEDFEFAARALRCGEPIKALKIRNLTLYHEHQTVATDLDRAVVTVRYDEARHAASLARLKEKLDIEFPYPWRPWLVKQSRLLTNDGAVGVNFSVKKTVRHWIKKLLALIA